jgi:hypothetical protein
MPGFRTDASRLPRATPGSRVALGVIAVGQRPAGTRYGYTVEARFTDDRAEGHRVEGRPCSVTWTRER